MHLVVNDVNQVHHDTRTIHGIDLDTGGIGAARQDGQLHVHNRIAVGCRQGNGIGAVAFVHQDLSVLVLEAHDLVARQGIALGAQVVRELVDVDTALVERHVDGTTRLVGADVTQPAIFGQLVHIGAHLHAVATLQFGEDRTKAAIHTRKLGMVAHVGVDFVGKVEHRRSLGQHDGVTLWREDDHVIVVERRNHRLHKSALDTALCHVAQYATELADPVFDTLGAVNHAAQLGVALHRLGADVYLGPLSHLRHHLHVDRLVAVLLGLVDVVDERIRTLVVEVGEQRIDAQALVLLRNARLFIELDDDVDLVHVLQFLERLSRVLHLAPQGIDRTGTGIDVCLDAMLDQSLANWLNKCLDVLAVHTHVAVDLLLDAVILLGRTPAEREIFEFRLDLIEAQSIGQRSIEVVGLRSDLHLLVGAHRTQGTHVVHTIGQFDEQSTNIVVDRVKHVLEVVDLLRNLVVAVRILGQHAHQVRHVFAETGTKVFHRVVGVLHHVVKQRCHHGIGLQSKFDQRNTRHGYRVGDIWDAALSDLFRVRLGCQVVGGLDARDIVSRQQFMHAFEELPALFLDNLLPFFLGVFVLHKQLPLNNLTLHFQLSNDTEQLLTQGLQTLYHFLSGLIARHIFFLQFTFGSIYRQSFDAYQSIENSHSLHILFAVLAVIAGRATRAKILRKRLLPLAKQIHRHIKFGCYLSNREIGLLHSQVFDVVVSLCHVQKWLKDEFRQFGDKYEKFHNKKQIFRQLFSFSSKKNLICHSTTPKNRQKKQISEIEHAPIGQTQFANSQILEK